MTLLPSSRHGIACGAAALVGLAALLTLPATSARAETRMWVKVDDGIRRTCPSMDCGAVGRFFPGESVMVYEKVDGWSRVSLYYSAGCYEGRSSYVEMGPSECTPENGIRNGEFAEWMRSDALAEVEGGQAG